MTEPTPTTPEGEIETMPTEAEMLASGQICQPGQPFACGDYHTAGQCLKREPDPAPEPTTEAETQRCPNCPPGADCEHGQYATDIDITMPEPTTAVDEPADGDALYWPETADHGPRIAIRDQLHATPRGDGEPRWISAELVSSRGIRHTWATIAESGFYPPVENAVRLVPAARLAEYDESGTWRWYRAADLADAAEAVDRLATVEDERDTARNQLAEAQRRLDAYHVTGSEADELRRRRADDLEVRGILSPNGYPRVVPMPLDDTLAPAIRWLVDDHAGRKDHVRVLAERIQGLEAEAGTLRDEARKLVTQARTTADDWRRCAEKRGATIRRVQSLADEYDTSAGGTVNKEAAALIRAAVAGPATPPAQPAQERPAAPPESDETREADSEAQGGAEAAGSMSEEEFAWLATELADLRRAASQHQTWPTVSAVRAADRLYAELIGARKQVVRLSRDLDEARQALTELRPATPPVEAVLPDRLTDALASIAREIRTAGLRGQLLGMPAPAPGSDATRETAETYGLWNLVETAWGVITNAGWDGGSKLPDWQEAAERWRDRYHAALNRFAASGAPPAAMFDVNAVDESMWLVEQYADAAVDFARTDRLLNAAAADTARGRKERAREAIRQRLTAQATAPQQPAVARLIEAAREWVDDWREQDSRGLLLPPDESDRELIAAVDAWDAAEPDDQADDEPEHSPIGEAGWIDDEARGECGCGYVARGCDVEHAGEVLDLHIRAEVGRG